MNKIFKFAIEPKETVQTIDLPQGAKIVSMDIQFVDDPQYKEMPICPRKEQVFFWAIVDPEAPMVPRRLMCVGTGWEIEPNIESYIGMVISEYGLVWHLLEVK